MMCILKSLLIALAVACVCVRSQCTCETEAECVCVSNDVTLLQTAATLESAESSPPPAAAGGASAAAVGVKANAAGNIFALIHVDITSLFALAFFFTVFTFLRQRYPIMFNYNSIIGLVKDTPPDDWTSWIWAALEKKRDEHVRVCGLDHAMLLEFSVMSMRMCAWISLPMTFLVGPLIALYGGAGAYASGQYLNTISINNVLPGSWIMYIYGVATCLVVFMLRYEINRSMHIFCEYRVDWLKHLPDPQASTVLVEGIPEEYQSEDKVREFFGKMFEPDDVLDVDMVLYIPELETAQAQLDTAKEASAKVNQEWINAGSREDARPQMSSFLSSASSLVGGAAETDAIKYYSAEVKRLEEEVATLKQAALKSAKEETGGINSSTAFVRFATRKESRTAISVPFSSDRNEWVVSAPSPPRDMIYSDLKVSEESKGTKRVIGIGMVVGLYIAFTPFCLWVTNIANSINLGPLQTLWSGYAPTLGLVIFLDFIPTVLISIFSMLFNYKSEINNQLQLQIWYFWFLFFFVILVTCVGQGFAQFIAAVAKSPLSLPIILANQLPNVTHYYLNFLGAQWLIQGMSLIRYMGVIKFVGFSKIYEEKDAKAKSEPEDQDYYGMGSRSARFTINLLIVVILGTMSPLMGMQAWVNFFVCRIIYGYLMVYAEGQKADSGGIFFVNQMEHIFIGMIFYVLLMLGLCLTRAPDFIPSAFCIVALIYTVFAWRRFEKDYEWEHLPWAEMVLNKDGSTLVRKDTTERYVQQVLL